MLRIFKAELIGDFADGQRILPIMAQILYRLCHLLGEDLEQTMQTLQAGGDESEEIMLMISMLPVLNKGE